MAECPDESTDWRDLLDRLMQELDRDPIAAQQSQVAAEAHAALIRWVAKTQPESGATRG